MDNIAIESFIQHCDEMMIAEEGILTMRLSVRIKRVWDKILELLERLLLRIKTLSNKEISIPFKVFLKYNNCIRKIDDALKTLETEMHNASNQFQSGISEDFQFNYNKRTEILENCTEIYNEFLDCMDKEKDNKRGTFTTVKVSVLYKKIVNYKASITKFTKFYNENIHNLANAVSPDPNADDKKEVEYYNFLSCLCSDIMKLYETLIKMTNDLLSLKKES